MKTTITTLALSIALTATAISQQAKPLSDSAFEALDKDVKTRPMLIPKGAAAPAPGTVRFDQAKAARVVILPNGQEKISPYVEVPILFEKNADELLDEVSRANLRKVAAELKSRGAQSQTFSIAGHASAEGDPQRNRDLSILRAARIQRELRSLGVPANVIVNSEGFGSEHAQFKNPSTASEAELQQDRRVLVVKEG